MEDKLQLLFLFTILFYISYTLLCKTLLPILSTSFKHPMLDKLNEYCKENSKYNLEFMIVIILSLFVSNVLIAVMCHLDLLPSEPVIKKRIIKLDNEVFNNMPKISPDNPFREFLME